MMTVSDDVMVNANLLRIPRGASLVNYLFESRVYIGADLHTQDKRRHFIQRKLSVDCPSYTCVLNCFATRFTIVAWLERVPLAIDYIMHMLRTLLSLNVAPILASKHVFYKSLYKNCGLSIEIGCIELHHAMNGYVVTNTTRIWHKAAYTIVDMSS